MVTNIGRKIVTWFKSNNIWYGQSKINFFLFIILFVIGLFLAFPKNIPFLGGEFHSVFAIKGIVETGIPEMPSGAIYLRNIMGHYLQAGSALLFGFSEFSLRLPIFLAFILFLVLFFDYSKKTYGLKTAMLALALVVSSGWLLRYTQYIRFYSLAIFLLFFAFYFFDRYFFKQGAKTDLYFFLLFGSIGVVNSRLGWAVFFLAIFVLFKYLGGSKENSFKKLGLSFLFLFMIFILSQQIPGKIIDNDIVFGSGGGGSNILGYLNHFFNNYSFSGVWEGYFDLLIKWFNGFFWLSLLPLVLLLVSKDRYLERILPVVFLLLVVIMINIGGLNREPPRIIAVVSPYFYLGLAITFGWLLDYLSSLVNRKFSSFLLIAGVISMILINTQFYFCNYYNTAIANNSSVFVGPLKTSYDRLDIADSYQEAQYIEDNFKEGDKIISTKIYGWDNYYLNGGLDRVIMSESIDKAAPQLIYLDKNNRRRLVFHDIHFLVSLESLRKYIANNDRVWLLVDDQAKSYNREPFLDFLSRKNDSLVSIKDDDSVDLYLFEN